MSINLRRSAGRCTALGSTAIVVALLLPVYASAEQGSATTPAVERATTRAQERATRAEERAVRKEERATRRNERAARNAARLGETGTTSQGKSDGNAPTHEPSMPGRGARGRCHLRLGATSRQIIAGETVTVFGRLSCATGTSPADQAVSVYRRQRAAGKAESGIVGTATTEADGSFELTPAVLDANSIFFARSQSALGAHTVVKVAPRVTLSGAAAGAQLATVSGRAHNGRRNAVTFTGTVSPVPAGAAVTLQREYAATGERWHSIAFGRVDPAGNYSFTHGFRIPGEVSVRVVVHPHGANSPAASEPLSYEISQAQNPQLTIQTSADPIAYGQSITLTGVAAGAANQPVTLLARTAGGKFTAVAQMLTDAAGNYTFSQSPVQSTYYRVTSATTASTVLVEGVKYALTSNGPLAATSNALVAGGQVTFSGTLAPARAGQAIFLERQYASGIGFHVIASGTVNANSTYSLVHSFSAAGSYVLRIRVPGDGANQTSTTTPFTFGVTRSPVPTEAVEEPVISEEGQA